MHGGVAKNALSSPDAAAVTRGLTNLQRHLRNLARFGVPALVCINRFGSDSEAELAAVVEGCAAVGVTATVCEHFAKGGAGAVDLAKAVVDTVEKGRADFTLLYPDELPLAKKIETIATQIYGAGEVVMPKPVADRLQEFEQQGFGRFPVCMAKTQYSFSANPDLLGAPSGFALPVREVRLSAGAEFVVAICGEIMTMPGLPRAPSAEDITVSADGLITGLS
jgi:formate--tetrahydrofolate ligase